MPSPYLCKRFHPTRGCSQRKYLFLNFANETPRMHFCKGGSARIRNNWGPNVGYQMSGDHMCSGPNLSQPLGLSMKTIFFFGGAKAQNSKELITLLSTEITSNVSSPMSVLSEFFFMRCTKIE